MNQEKRLKQEIYKVLDGLAEDWDQVTMVGFKCGVKRYLPELVKIAKKYKEGSL